MRRTASQSISIALLLSPVLLVSGSAYAEGHTIEFKNTSDWSIQQLYLSSTKQNEWGSDQFGKQVVNKGESFELSGIPAGKYDLKVVDEDGDECIVSGVKIAESEAIEIDNESLLGCQAATESAAEEDEDEGE